MGPTKDTRQLNWFLAWAVVFCDIGTSVYYVPGILYGHVKDATPFFVLLTTGGFILLSLKYIEISWRNPEGGGVVTITTKAFGPMWGCLGGMLITVDYFLTTAISAVAGFQYVGSVFTSLDAHVVLLSCAGVGVLAALNIIGIRESAAVSLVMACASFIVNLIVIGAATATMNSVQWNAVLSRLGTGHGISTYELLVGFASAWLAFSGLESISQLSPAMRFPLRQTTRRAMIAVILTMVVTSPILTALSIGLLPEQLKATESERFISELGMLVGGLGVKLAVVLTGATIAHGQERVGTSCADCPNYNGAFSIENSTGVTIPYEYKWGDNHPWKRMSLRSGQIETHSYPLGDNRNGRAPRPYVRFDRIGGDGRYTPKEYHMEFHAIGYSGYGPKANNTQPKRYYFKYGADGKSLDILAR